MDNILKIRYWYWVLSISSILINNNYAQYPVGNRIQNNNKFAINVAYAAVPDEEREEYKHLGLINSYMPSKLPDGNNFFWQQGTFEIPVNDELYAGTRISNVKQGIFSQQAIEQALAYRVSLSKYESLSFGLSFGINLESIDSKKGYSSNQFVDLQDPLFNGEIKTQIDLRSEVGIVYKWNDFEAAIAVPFLIQDKGFPYGLNAYAGYKLYINRDLDITPSVLLMKTYSKKYEITGSINFMINNSKWFQLGYVDSKQLLLGVGIRLKAVDIGYSFSLPFDKQYSSLVSNTHQLGLGFYL